METLSFYKKSQTWQKIQELDLKEVMRKVEKENPDTKISDTGYRQFLYLIREKSRLNLGFKLIPTKEIDKVWHNHILHTKKYANDCNRILGNFIHHYPHFDENKTEYCSKDFLETVTLSKKIFGEHSKFTGLSGDCDSDAPGGGCDGSA